MLADGPKLCPLPETRAVKGKPSSFGVLPLELTSESRVSTNTKAFFEQGSLEKSLQSHSSNSFKKRNLLRPDFSGILETWVPGIRLGELGNSPILEMAFPLLAPGLRSRPFHEGVPLRVALGESLVLSDLKKCQGSSQSKL